MRAAQLSELKQPPRLVELDDVDGIHVEAVALNPLDIAVGSGVFYGGHPELPYVPGCEAAGRRADGARVYLFGDGRGVSKPGFLAERVGVPDDLPLAVPAGTDPALAAVAGVAGIAGWVPVAW
jgi:NADPH:quinone reductase-like Zn-dependent oxidoreductase